MKTLQCNCGRLIFVDDEDYERVKTVSWGCYGDNVVRGYLQGTRYSIANFILGVAGLVDHKDRDKHVNIRSNLRPATKAQNNQNNGIRSDNGTGYKGVAFNKRLKKFTAYIYNKDKQEWLGTFTSAEQAATAYNNRAKELFGEFAYLNKISEPITVQENAKQS